MDPNFYPIEENLVECAKTEPDAVFLVDLGGGKGRDLHELHRKHPNLPGQLVLQDLENVIEEAKASGLDERIIPMAHDFFTEQPVKGTCPSNNNPTADIVRCTGLSHTFLLAQLVRCQSPRDPHKPQASPDERLQQAPHQRICHTGSRGSLAEYGSGYNHDVQPLRERTYRAGLACSITIGWLQDCQDLDV